MPPKKTKISLTTAQKKRGEFNRKRLHSNVQVIRDPDFQLFDSLYHKPELKVKTTKEKKKKPVKKQIVPVFPDVSDVNVSSDEEGAGQFRVPDADADENEKAKEMNAALDIDEFSSFEMFNQNGEQVDIVNGKHVVRSIQPPAAWRPGVYEDLVGNYPKINRPAMKKNALIKKVAPKKKPPIPIVPPEPVEMTVFQKSLGISLHNALFRDSRKFPIQSFRVFNTPIRQKITLFNPPPSTDKIGRPSVSHPDLDGSFTELDFRPGNASTPIEHKVQNRKTKSFPVFNFSDEEESEKTAEGTEKVDDNTEKTPKDKKSGEFKMVEQVTLEPSMTSKGLTHHEPPENISSYHSTAKEKTANTLDHYSEDIEEDLEATSSMNRKAETSVTELLDNEHREENVNPNCEDSKYSKKRQRTKSPETMCQGMSTVLTMQNEPDDIASMFEQEKENAVRKRGTLQPQQRQRDRESRISRLSVMSVASSCHESINSAMEDMSLDQQLLDEETMGFDMGKTQFSESRAESRNVPTGMTIHNEDPSMLPFYLADGTFEVEPSTMAQLLHVAGQKETKTWGSLPKTAFDGRRVKKLGEGSYGEVFSTIWEERQVAIKVVPFEADHNNRLYNGKYHSDHMQSSAEILPELIVMKELNQLKNIDEENSTPNFIEMIAAEIVTGNYPKGLLKAWDNYTSIKESQNIRPDIYSSKEQNFIVLVSANGGVALEDFVLNSEHEFFSILFQLTLSLVAAETLLEFEHRDLHLGNVLIDRNGVEELDYKITGHRIPLKAHGVKVNIIDFTLSRISKGPTTVFLDLAQDPSLFEGQGDPQFDVYRAMRENCKDDWKKFERRTNLMWIEFIANRLLEAPICPEGLLPEDRIMELRELISQLGTYTTCQESLADPEFFNKFYQGYFGEVALPQVEVLDESE